MSKIALETIQDYILSNKQPDTAELNYETFTIPVKTSLTIEEKLRFVEAVISNSFMNSITPSFISKDVAFIISFLEKICVDFPIPTNEVNDDIVIDAQAAYDMATALQLLDKYALEINSSLLDELKECVNRRIEFETNKIISFASRESNTSEAIATFSMTMNKLSDLFDTAINQIEKNGNKLFENMTPDILNNWGNILQTILISNLKQGEK